MPAWILTFLLAWARQESVSPVPTAAATAVPADTSLSTEQESPYGRWSMGPPTDPDWFPIGVWLQDPALAERYAKLGINTFVGLWEGPTEGQLRSLRGAGMKVVCAQNRVGMAHVEDPTVIAWMLVDEPDNRAKGRVGAKQTPEQVARGAEVVRHRDGTRPIWLNLGQGVANDGWKGRGARRSDYPLYAKTADILSFDVYPVTNMGKEDGGRYLGVLARGLSRLERWGGPSSIRWNFVETTRGPHPTKRPSPEQIRAEVWISLIAGSRGIVYFCHEFVPEVRAAALLADPVRSRAVADINAEILSFAPWLNSPTVSGAATVGSESTSCSVGILAKRHGNELMLFTINLRAEPAHVRIGLTEETQLGLGEQRRARVVAEDRTLPIINAGFEADYGPYERHIFSVRD